MEHSRKRAKDYGCRTGERDNRWREQLELVIKTVYEIWWETTLTERLALQSPYALERTEEAKQVRKQYEAGEIKHGFHELSELHPRTDGKTNTLSTVLKDNQICEPIRIGCMPSPDGTIKNSQGMRLYSVDGKAVNQTANGGGLGAKTGLYAVPIEVAELSDEYYHGDKDGQLFGKIVCKNTSDNKGQPAQGTRIYNTDCKSICLGDSRKYIIDKITEELTPYVENKIPEIVEKIWIFA